MVFATLISSGIPNSISKYTPTYNKKQQNGLILAGFNLTLLITIISIIFIFLFKKIFINTFLNNQSYYLILSMIPALISTGIYSSFKGYFWGKELFFQSSLIEFVEQIIRIIACFLLFLFLDSKNKFLSPGISISIGCILSTIIGIIYYFKIGGKLNHDKKLYKPLIKSSSPITAVRLLGSIIQPIIAIIMPIRLMSFGYSNEQALSELGITMGMTMPLLSIPFTLIGSLSMALIPKVSLLNSNNNNKDLKKQINSSIQFSLICIFLIIPIFISLGKEICLVIFSNEIAGKYLIYSSFLMVPMGLSMLTTTILNAMGKESKSFIYYLISSIFLFISVWFLPKYLGIISVIVGLGISSLLTSILNLNKINKLIDSSNYYINHTLKLIFISIPPIILTKLIYNILIKYIPMFFSVSFSCVISLIATLVLFITFKIIDLEATFLKIKNLKIKHKKV